MFRSENFYLIETIGEAQDCVYYVVLARWQPLEPTKNKKTLVYWQTNMTEPRWVFSDDFSGFGSWNQLNPILENQRAEANGTAYVLEDSMRTRATVLFVKEAAKFREVELGLLKTIRNPVSAGKVEDEPPAARKR